MIGSIHPQVIHAHAPFVDANIFTFISLVFFVKNALFLLRGHRLSLLPLVNSHGWIDTLGVHWRHLSGWYPILLIAVVGIMQRTTSDFIPV
jgi:hypothetical protein